MSSLGWSHKGLTYSDYWPNSETRRLVNNPAPWLQYTRAMTVEEAEVLIQETFDEATEMLEVLNKYKKHLIDLKEKK